MKRSDLTRTQLERLDTLSCCGVDHRLLSDGSLIELGLVRHCGAGLVSLTYKGEGVVCGGK